MYNDSNCLLKLQKEKTKLMLDKIRWRAFSFSNVVNEMEHKAEVLTATVNTKYNKRRLNICSPTEALVEEMGPEFGEPWSFSVL